MQVKKFEAPSMKEALELIRAQLGPDAIILSVKDYKKSFGLAGQGSVEVTAAISDTQLRKKEFAESRLRQDDKARLKASPARAQSQFIQKSVSRYMPPPVEAKRDFSKMRYVDIPDDEIAEAAPVSRRTSTPMSVAETYGHRVTDVLDRMTIKSQGMTESSPPSSMGERRVKEAVGRAFAAFQEEPNRRLPQAPLGTPKSPVATPANGNQMNDLQNQIKALHTAIERMETSSRSQAPRHPGAEFGVPYELSSIYERLQQQGVAPELCIQILDQASRSLSPVEIKKKPVVSAWVARYLLETLKVSANPYQGRIHIFAGPPGSGKTSSLIKMASHAIINEKKKVAVLSADLRKVGAIDQMKIFAQILNVPFAMVRSHLDWAPLLDQLHGIDLILVDFPGSSLKNLDEVNEIKSLLPEDIFNPQIHLVQNVCHRDQDLLESARRYQLLKFHDVIFTNLDLASQFGCLYNFSQTVQVPLHSFGKGPQIPEDFEYATAERVIDLIFRITQSESQLQPQSKIDQLERSLR